ICKQMACKVARRSLCGIAAKAVTHLWRCAAAFFVCGFSTLSGGGVLWNLLRNVLGFTEESLSQPAAASSLFKGAIYGLTT
ncbi:hypothetical protein, partial [Ruminococcus callidus]|uniref:hypothetical protein n=1 Tax=Ruminococcus callidus TaxID=40519 RepID=UPI003FD7777F